MQDLAVEVLGGLEADSRRAVELGDDHALRAVDDEGPAACHHRQLAHVNTLLFGAGLILQLEGHVESGGEGLAVAEGVEGSDLGILDVVGDEIQLDRLVVGLDRENLAEHRLKARVGTVTRRDFLLEEFVVRPALNLDEVGWFDDLFKFSEIETFSHGVGVVVVLRVQARSLSRLGHLGSGDGRRRQMRGNGT